MGTDTLLEARSVGFVAGGYRVDVELLDDGGVVLGQLDPGGPAEVVLETEAGARTTGADDRGRFCFESARGPLRLRVSPHDGPVVLTPWLTW